MIFRLIGLREKKNVWRRVTPSRHCPFLMWSPYSMVDFVVDFFSNTAVVVERRLWGVNWVGWPYGSPVDGKPTCVFGASDDPSWAEETYLFPTKRECCIEFSLMSMIEACRLNNDAITIETMWSREVHDIDRYWRVNLSLVCRHKVEADKNKIGRRWKQCYS